jgi:hypothetical protein
MASLRKLRYWLMNSWVPVYAVCGLMIASAPVLALLIAYGLVRI